MHEIQRLYVVFVIACCFTSAYLYPSSFNIRDVCPRLFPQVFKGYVPQGNITAGTYLEIPDVTQLDSCVLRCCKKTTCNVAFISDDKCFHVTCYSNELCVPKRHNAESVDHLLMVLVKPTDDENWEEVLSPQDYSKEQLYIGLPHHRLQDMRMDGSYAYESVACELGTDIPCIDNEVCVQNRPKSRGGTCKCKEGFIRTQEGDCLPDEKLDGYHTLPEILTERILDITTPNKSLPVTRRQLTVTAESKEVRLPESEVTLNAQVVDGDDSSDKYQFEWMSLLQPDGSTAVKHQNGGNLHLEKLSEGVYAFKVTASAPGAYGETFVNVTVQPASRINKPPKIIITPSNQTIKQPNAAAVLDASASTDDDRIVAWHWELQQGPLGYQPALKDTPTLQLNDLTKPGNYSFKLTVTDTDKETSSSTANVTVLKFTDYPPEANAGEEKIIYLPHNAITLNGNLSTDDHAITTWEWTKSADDAQKAVDMQDTRTPYLQLSNLEEGMYTFTLRVTDSANQSSTAQVHVFVKPPTNKPPVANPGPNMTISLPQTWVVVNAGDSTDDNKIVAYNWEQIEGPSTVTFVEGNNVSRSNVTGLTKGVYTFKLSVTDDNKNVASDLLYVTVNQNKNQKPTANAGDDFTVNLPQTVVFLNGSKSTDDWAIVKWKWVRDAQSLAVGKIAPHTVESPVLIITDVAIGKYIFNLTVYDEQGLSDTDQVVFVVKNNPKLFYLVEITIDTDANFLTDEQYRTLKGKLALLVTTDGSKLQVQNDQPDPVFGKSKITFYVETPEGKPISANEVVAHLRQKLRVDGSLLGVSVAKLQTTICQNNCSGHGVCNEQTRQCECEAFWMQDMFKVYLKTDEDSDCSWSILYVVLGAVCTVMLLIGSMWALVYAFYAWCTKNKTTTKPTSYKLIEDTEDLPPFSGRKSNLSDSDTDSDVVFESRNKPSRFGESRNGGHKASRNGYSKMGGRRIKT